MWFFFIDITFYICLQIILLYIFFSLWSHLKLECAAAHGKTYPWPCFWPMILKMNQIGVLPLPICVPNLRAINPMPFGLSHSLHLYSEWLQHEVIISPFFGYGRKITIHDDVIKGKHFPRNWPFVRGIHRSPVNSPHRGQWRVALICAWINASVNNREAGDLRRHRFHYDVIVMGGK